MKSKTTKIMTISIAAIMLLGACTPQLVDLPQDVEEDQVLITGGDALDEITAEEEFAPEPAEIVFIAPIGNVPEPFRTLEDSSSKSRASEKRAISGDNFLNNLYERPFTSEEMTYQPDLDIQTVDFAFDDDFFYFTIHLAGMNPDPWGLNGMYAIEIDRDLNGRGEVIIVTEGPDGTEWSVNQVSVFFDSIGDVGGPDPIIPNTGFSGSGFDAQLELQAESAAFSRIDPDNPQAIQIVFHRSLIGDPEQFLWGAWADNGIRDLSMFYYNDAFTLGVAGSPILGRDYPLKELFNLDNTCKLPYGFSQSAGNIPGMCKQGVPAPGPGQKQQIVCEPPYYWINGKCQYFG